MSIPTTIYWAPATGNFLSAIASLQNVVAGRNLVLNSNAPDDEYWYNGGIAPYYNSPPPQNIARTVSLTSNNNLSGVNFTISGVGSPVDGDGNPTVVFDQISQTIAGPNNNTVETTFIFTQIFSITPNNNVNGVSAGFGKRGITNYIFLDYNRKFFAGSVQLQMPGNTTSATVYGSLTKPEIININQGNLYKNTLIPAFPISVALTNATANQLGSLSSPLSIIWANINTQNYTNTGEVYFTVLQQGIS